jgi:hypothetical protein
LHKIGWRDSKILISISVREPGKIGQTAWQNQLDVTKIGSATVRVNGALIHDKEQKSLIRKLYHGRQGQVQGRVRDGGIRGLHGNRFGGAVNQFGLHELGDVEGDGELMPIKNVFHFISDATAEISWSVCTWQV